MQSYQNSLILFLLLFLFFVFGCTPKGEIEATCLFVFDSESGSPLSGASVSLRHYHQYSTFDWEVETEYLGETDDQGSICFHGLSNHNDSIRIEMEGYLVLQAIVKDDGEIIIIYSKEEDSSEIEKKIIDRDLFDEVYMYKK